MYREIKIEIVRLINKIEDFDGSTYSKENDLVTKASHDTCKLILKIIEEIEERELTREKLIIESEKPKHRCFSQIAVIKDTVFAICVCGNAKTVQLNFDN